MATVKEKSRGQWSQAEDGSESATITWEVLATSYAETLSSILSSSGVPARGDGHPENPYALCRQRRLNLVDGFDDLYILEADYDTKRETKEDEDDPFSWQVKGGMRGVLREVPAYFDAFGYPLVNTAGDLFEGLTRFVPGRVIPCRMNFASVPNWLFDLAGSVNASAVTIHGASYPAGTCKLLNPEMPDEPAVSPLGVEYWPITYEIEINPDGWFQVLPNQGQQEIVYQTLEVGSGSGGATLVWVDADLAAYNAADPDYRRKLKRRIQTDEQQDTATALWLDWYGRAVRVPQLNTASAGTGNMTAGSADLTFSGLDELEDVGKLVVVIGAGPFGRPLVSSIASISGGTVTLSSVARTTVTGAAVYLPGVVFRYAVLERLADWSSVPLPNNQP